MELNTRAEKERIKYSVRNRIEHNVHVCNIVSIGFMRVIYVNGMTVKRIRVIRSLFCSK